ncbi:MAG: T9SS type A sorting domain-containing protein [Flavobacterium sp.]|nr:T9SS type A sorting domain-containing protein [Flavobacterium sp.]
MKKKYTFVKLAIITAFLFFSTSNAQIIANGTYKIFSTVHNEVMTCATTAPHDANMATPNATDNYQLWTFTHQGGDIYKIVNQGNNLTLGINDGWCGVFGDVKANFSNTDANVEFKVSNSSIAGKYVFEIAFTTCNFGSVNLPVKAFDIQDGAAGAQIQTYDVDITNANQQFQIVDPATLSSNSFNNSTKFQVYYSALNGLNIISKESILTHLNIKIYDITGKQIKKQIANSNNSNSLQMNVNDLTKGVYLVHVTENNRNSVHKIIITKYKLLESKVLISSCK